MGETIKQFWESLKGLVGSPLESWEASSNKCKDCGITPAGKLFKHGVFKCHICIDCFKSRTLRIVKP